LPWPLRLVLALGLRVLTEQLGVNITDAFARLPAYAYGNDLRLADVARDIVARRLRLHPGSGPSSAIDA
jgi:hypothetical protein